MSALQRSLASAGFSGRGDYTAFTSAKPIHLRVRPPHRKPTEHRLQTDLQAQAEASKGFGDSLKNIARQVQAALPIVGLISRLAATSGGVGRDELAYPEFARQLLDRADPAFNAAVSSWEERHGRVGQRRYIVLFLWMAYTGLGIVPRKAIANAAMRLRVTHDITAEVERFELERQNAFSAFTIVERPKGKTADQISLAVDCLCRLSIGLKDGEAIPEEDQQLIIPLVEQTFSTEEGAADFTLEAVTDQARQSRKTANQ